MTSPDQLRLFDERAGQPCPYSGRTLNTLTLLELKYDGGGYNVFDCPECGRKRVRVSGYGRVFAHRVPKGG